MIVKSFVQKLVREPALVLGVITAGLSLAVLFGADITTDQMAGIGIFVSALFALTRYLTTPTSEVVAQRFPGGKVVAGPVIPEAKGLVVDVHLTPTQPPSEVDVQPPT